MPEMAERGDIVIRDARSEDAPQLVEIYDHYVRHTAITFEYETPSVDEFRERMRRVMARYPYLVAERDGVVQGYAYAGAFHPRAAYGAPPAPMKTAAIPSRDTAPFCGTSSAASSPTALETYWTLASAPVC